MLKTCFVLLILFFCGHIRGQKQEPNNKPPTIQIKTELYEKNKTYYPKKIQGAIVNFPILSKALDGCSFLTIKSLKTSKGYFIEISNSNYYSTYNVTINGKQYPIELGLSDADICFIPTSGKYQICSSFSCTYDPCCQYIQLR